MPLMTWERFVRDLGAHDLLDDDDDDGDDEEDEEDGEDAPDAGGGIDSEMLYVASRGAKGKKPRTY